MNIIKAIKKKKEEKRKKESYQFHTNSYYGGIS